MLNPSHLITTPATLTRTSTSGVDAYNNPVETTSTESVLAFLEQIQRDESTAGGDIQEQRWRIVLKPSASPVTGHDRITVGSNTFEFVGPPWEATNPRTGQVSHIEAEGRRVS